MTNLLRRTRTSATKIQKMEKLTNNAVVRQTLARVLEPVFYQFDKILPQTVHDAAPIIAYLPILKRILLHLQNYRLERTQLNEFDKELWFATPECDWLSTCLFLTLSLSMAPSF